MPGICFAGMALKGGINVSVNNDCKNEDENVTENEAKLTPEEKKLLFSHGIVDWTETFATAIVAVMLIFTFLFRVVSVDGGSMMETLYDREKLIISDFFYKPCGGDVIVTRVDEYGDEPLVKRIIATGGQTVDIDFDNWIVSVDGSPIGGTENGVPVRESYVNYMEGFPMRMENPDIMFPLTVPEGYVFILGDNRNNSRDSRAFGIVDERNIIGRVYFRIFPFNRFGPIKAVRPVLPEQSAG